jgi:hypothetical protein
LTLKSNGRNFEEKGMKRMEKSGAGAVAGNHAGHFTVITDDGIANSIYDAAPTSIPFSS